MTTRSGITSEGALQELLARGNKDTFFFKDSLETSVSPFDNRIQRTPPMVHELRRIPPFNGSDWGRSCEFEMEVAGDVFIEPTLLIELPSWLPSSQVAQNPSCKISDTSGVTYGQTRCAAQFLFEKIQLYQDKILLQEFSGDALQASQLSRGSLSSALLDLQVAGNHDGSALGIARNATPGLLRLKLPLLGCQSPEDGGIPSIAMRGQSFRLRLFLRKPEDLVEASDARESPAPWGRSDFQVQDPLTGQVIPFSTIERHHLASPTIQLETRHIQVDSETQQALQRASLEIPFSRLQENTFTAGPADQAPLLKGGTAAITRRLDATHPASRLLWQFRSTVDLRANRRQKFTSDTSADGEQQNQASLVIASRDREVLNPARLWNGILHSAKEDRQPGAGIGTMAWDLGDLRGRIAPFSRMPEGAVNFSTADRPTMQFELASAPEDPKKGGPSTEITVLVDTWAVYSIENNRGSLKYGN